MIRRAAAFAIVLMFAAGGVVAQDERDATTGRAEPERIVGTFANEHFWFVTSDGATEARLRLYHHADEMNGPFFRTPVALDTLPVALAAFDNQAWVVVHAPDGGLELYTLRAFQNPATGLYFHRPPSRLEFVGALPEGDAEAMAGAERGPIVAMRSGDTTTLHIHKNGAWARVDAPIVAGDRVRSLVSMGHGHLCVVVERSSGEVAILERVSIDAAWSVWSTVVSPEAIEGLYLSGDRLTLVTELRGEQGDSYQVMLLRRGELFRVGRVAQPDQPHILGAGSAGLALVWLEAPGDVRVQWFDGQARATGGAEVMLSQPLSDATTLYLPIIVTGLIFAMVFVIVLRPLGKEDVQLPPHMHLADLTARAAALMIDFAPAGVAALLIFRLPPAALLHSPLWSGDVTAGLPLLVAAGLTAAHSFAFEAVTGRSLAKRILGLAVVTVNGARPRLWQVLVRNLLKVTLILLPPLGLFAIVNPYRQRLGDVLARTVVVRIARPLEG